MPDSAISDAKNFGGVGLRPLIVKQEVDDLTFCVWKLLNGLVEGYPGLQAAAGTRRRGRFDSDGYRTCSVRGADGVGSIPLAPEVMTPEVDQFPAHLSCCQTIKIGDRLGVDFPQGAKQTYRGVLHDIVGLLVPSKVRVATQHPMGVKLEPFAGHLEDRVSCPIVSGPETN
jgi:hypothetical protein